MINLIQYLKAYPIELRVYHVQFVVSAGIFLYFVHCWAISTLWVKPLVINCESSAHVYTHLKRTKQFLFHSVNIMENSLKCYTVFSSKVNPTIICDYITSFLFLFTGWSLLRICDENYYSHPLSWEFLTCKNLWQR